MGNTNNNNKTLIYTIGALILISILSIIFIFQVTNTINKIKSIENTGDEPVIKNQQQEDSVDNAINIDKYILDTPELVIRILKIREGDKNGTKGVYIDTVVQNNIDKYILIESVNEHNKSSESGKDEPINISYYFTAYTNEEITKEMFIPNIDINNLTVSFKLNISDSFEQTLLYESDIIIIQVKDKEPTIIKSSNLINMNKETPTQEEKQLETENIESDNKVEAAVELEQEVVIEQEIEIETDEKLENTENNIDELPIEVENTEKSDETEENTQTEQEIEPEVTTKIGDYRYGFYTLPGEFKLVKEDENYIEYMSPDFINVSINYRENTTIEDFKIKLINDYGLQFPTAYLEKVHTDYMNVLVDSSTGKLIIKTDEETQLEDSETSPTDETPVDDTSAELENADTTTEDTSNTEEQNIINRGFYYEVYRYQVAVEDGNYVMLVTTAPETENIVTIGILVPYDLNDKFAKFVESVVYSYEFIQ